jgi:hypothetical protein
MTKYTLILRLTLIYWRHPAALIRKVVNETTLSFLASISLKDTLHRLNTEGDVYYIQISSSHLTVNKVFFH